MKSREEIAVELDEAEFTLSESDRQDVISIASLLNDPESVADVLDGLEAKVKKEAYRQIDKVNEKQGAGGLEMTEEDYLDEINDPHGRMQALSNVLYKWAIKNDLVNKSSATKGFFTKFNAFLQPGEFEKHIARGEMFKDRGASAEPHGVWTHFLQWYVIIENFKKNNDPGLAADPRELYMLCGKATGIQVKGTDGKPLTKPKKISLWYWLCDDNSSNPNRRMPNDADKQNPLDLRNPDFMHSFIVDNHKRFKFLSKLVVYSDLKKAQDKTGKYDKDKTIAFDTKTREKEKMDYSKEHHKKKKK